MNLAVGIGVMCSPIRSNVVGLNDRDRSELCGYHSDFNFVCDTDTWQQGNALSDQGVFSSLLFCLYVFIALLMREADCFKIN